GSSYWDEVINFDALVKYGTISEADLSLFQRADDPETALKILQEGLTKHHLTPQAEQPPEPAPEIAKSRI
ncbi:MAG: lysine decarboxylase, partial [Bryobacteraceae bacterium]